MFGIIRNTIERRTATQSAALANSEIYPDLYLDRQKAIRNRTIAESIAMIGTIALAAFAAFVWLAYEGIITPEMFK